MSRDDGSVLSWCPKRDVARLILRCSSLSSRFARDNRASLALKFGLLLPVIFGVVGGAIDYGSILRQKSRLQSAADAAAKAAALEFTLIDTSKNDISAMTEATVRGMVNADALASAGTLQVLGRAQTNPMRVTVDAVQQFKGPFGVLGGSASRIAVRAVAEVVGKPNICVLALEPDADGAIELWTKAQLTGQNCAVYSNSTSSAGIKSKNNASMSASMICSAGGKDGAKGNFSPEPVTDCPIFDDPLAGRAAPAVGACTATKMRILNESLTLQPGVYCGGLSIAGTSSVTFARGIYVIKDGALRVEDSAAVAGDGVGFYLTGPGSLFRFDGGTTISLSAPTSGEMAGLLFHEARSRTDAVTHEILSDNARLLLGTIYLPKGELRIDAKKPVADQSAYTAIVVRQLRLYSGPNLVLNTNYSASPVPVPEGIKGVGQPVALVQ
jgi:Flp pilus assembly protein TadG